MELSSIWSKTLLSALKAAPAVNRHFDKLIAGRAVRVPGVSHERQSDFDSTYRQVDKILCCIESKKKVLNLLFIVDEIMSKVHINYRKALYLKYRYSKNPVQIQQLLGCTLRTYFRYLKAGIKQFSEIRERLGYGDGYLQENFGKEYWLINLMQRVTEEHESNKLRANRQGLLKEKAGEGTARRDALAQSADTDMCVCCEDLYIEDTEKIEDIDEAA